MALERPLQFPITRLTLKHLPVDVTVSIKDQPALSLISCFLLSLWRVYPPYPPVLQMATAHYGGPLGLTSCEELDKGIWGFSYCMVALQHYALEDDLSQTEI
jgi:hypothetical protein